MDNLHKILNGKFAKREKRMVLNQLLKIEDCYKILKIFK